MPILRAGEPYCSLDRVRLTHVATGAPVAQVSQANPGLIGRDLAAIEKGGRALEAFSAAELVARCGEAARFFAEGELALDQEMQSPADYARQVSATTGLPQTLCREHMEKIRRVLANMEQVLEGLTRGLDLSLLDEGWGLRQGRPLCYVCQTGVLGAVLPNNSPGVHSLWLPALPLKVPLALRPGRTEPWTPLRLVRALVAAGCPPQAFGFYPSDYGGAAEMLLRCGRSLLFGGEAVVGGWREDPRVQLHGPGRSKVVFGEDGIGEWERHLDLMVRSAAAKGGRSCLNASGVWVPARGREVAEALAGRLGRIEPRALDDPRAELAAFAPPELARRLSERIDHLLRVPGAEELTAGRRAGERVVEKEGCTFLAPTVLWCEDAEHPLANTEFLFPFLSVVQVPQREMVARMGPTLVATAITDDAEFRRQLLGAPHIERLNLGAVETNEISWDQPHEGNLFDFLYEQRALQVMA